MKQDADVIVIGGGIGGVAAGSLLAHAGRRVVLLERNAFLDLGQRHNEFST
ncbi:MAG: FAD-dependent oxidoreductase, partial [Thermodesulfobacteriota bacterium]